MIHILIHTLYSIHIQDNFKNQYIILQNIKKILLKSGHSSSSLSNATITSSLTKIEGLTNYTTQQQTTTRHQLPNLTEQQ